MTKSSKIEKNYLVVCDVGPLIMTENKDKAINSLKIARLKGHRGYVQEITASSDRLKEIGKNLFKRKITPIERMNILETRGKVIREYIDVRDDNDYTDEVAWKRVVKNNKLSGFVDLDDFSQWTLDVREFNPYDNPKLLLDEGADGSNN
jgi:hypothetical protein